jgi:hypothetical protein
VSPDQLPRRGTVPRTILTRLARGTWARQDELYQDMLAGGFGVGSRPSFNGATRRLKVARLIEQRPDAEIAHIARDDSGHGPRPPYYRLTQRAVWLLRQADTAERLRQADPRERRCPTCGQRKCGRNAAQGLPA